MARPADPVVAFYSGGADHRGRTLSGILDWPDDRLESVHDYIQWVFPTEAPSGVNPFAPLVTRETKQAFTDRPDLRDRLRLALDRLLAFYGLRRAAGPDGDARIEIDPARFPARSAVWLQPGNHNHLRLTRIIQSLASLGLRSDAAALQRCLLDEAGGAWRHRISPVTLQYWRAALPGRDRG